MPSSTAKDAESARPFVLGYSLFVIKDLCDVVGLLRVLLIEAKFDHQRIDFGGSEDCNKHAYQIECEIEFQALQDTLNASQHSLGQRKDHSSCSKRSE